MTNNDQNYLGIDWGASDVGIAFSDAETKIAFALPRCKNDKKLLENLGEIIKERQIGTAVIGIPSHVNRKSVVYEGERLGEVLKKEFGISVAYANEMFTTKRATQNLIEKGIRNISRFDDSEAARIILQEWLDGNF